MAELAAKKEATAKKKAQEAEEKAKKVEEEKKKRADEIKARQQDAKHAPAIKTSVGDAKQHVGKRIQVSGWCHQVRKQGSKLIFIELRDGTGFPALLQSVLESKNVDVSTFLL